MDEREHWLMSAAIVVFTVQVTVPAFVKIWRTRREKVTGNSNPATAALGLLDVVSFHRRSLVRERDELRGGLGWQGWSSFLGFSLLLLGFPLERHSGWTWPLAGFVTLVLAGVGFLLVNRAKANRLQARIDAAH
jgi:drug/metabolite transporter (DMT)-like permease